MELVTRQHSIFAGEDLPALLGREASDPSSPLRRALSEVFTRSPESDSRVGAKLLPPSSALMGWDDFQRSNRTLDGDRAPSGQIYRVGGTPESNPLRDGRYAPQSVPRRASILYVGHRRSPDTLAAEFVWSPAASYGANVVLGSCGLGFGAGSIQLALYSRRESRRDYDWSLFMVPDPVQDPYPVIARGLLREGFVWTMDGASRYRVYLHRIESDKVMAQLPDGQIITQQHPAIATYWGRVSGTQLRRPRVSDGFAEFTAIASSGAL